MRTALALVLLVVGIVAVRSAFAPNPDPRVVVRRLFGDSGAMISGGAVRRDSGATMSGGGVRR